MKCVSCEHENHKLLCKHKAGSISTINKYLGMPCAVSYAYRSWRLKQLICPQFVHDKFIICSLITRVDCTHIYSHYFICKYLVRFLSMENQVFTRTLHTHTHTLSICDCDTNNTIFCHLPKKKTQ